MPSFPTGRLRAAQVLLLSSLALAAATTTRAADASIVVPKGGAIPHASSLKVALASNAQRSVVWEQLALDAGEGTSELAWIVAVPKGGWIEGADPTWFEALDAVSAPVIAPSKSLGCTEVANESTAEPKATVPPRTIDRALFAQTSGALAFDKLKAAGYSVDSSTAAMLASVDAAGEEVVVLHLPAGMGATRVIRVLGPPNRPLPLALAPTGTRSTKLLTWVLASSRTKLADLSATEPPFDRLVWLGTQSNYKTLLDDTVGAVSGAGVALPFASPDALFSDQPTGTVGRTIPSLVRAYFGADDDAGSAPWACAKHANGYATSDKTVSPSCALPTPWTSDGSLPPCASAAKDTLSPGDFVCGGRDDVAVALGGAPPAHVWITRLESWSFPRTTPATLESTSLGSLPVFHEAKSLGAGACPPVVSNPPGSGGDPTGSTDPNGGYDPGQTNQPYPPTAHVIVHDGCSSSGAGTGCGKSSSSTSDDGCSKKDGGSSDSSSCGKSSSGSSSDDGCGKSGSGDSCGKGSSSSSSDSGCGGGSSSGSGGGCGSAGSGADKGCAVAPAIPRLKFSILGYVAMAVATVLRRATRRRRRGPDGGASSKSR